MLVIVTCVRSKPIKYVSDEEDFESAKSGSNLGEKEFGIGKKVPTTKQVSNL